MKVIASIKKLKNDLVVTFEDHTDMTIVYDIYLKYHLEPSLVMDEKTFREMQEENAFLFFKRMALKKLARMMTAYELYTFLIEKGSKEGIAKQIIHDFKLKKYIDDDAYAKWYVSMKQMQEGPRLITEKLKQKGIASDVINTYVSQIDEYACLKDSIDKKLKGKTHQNRHQLTMKLKRFYVQKGFSLDVVSACVKEAVSSQFIDEKALLKADIDKLIRKSKETIDKQKMIEKLYRKGYRYDDIKEALEGIDI